MATQRSDDPRVGGSPPERVSEPPDPASPAAPPVELPDSDEQSTILAPDPFEPVLPDPAKGPDAGALE